MAEEQADLEATENKGVAKQEPGVPSPNPLGRLIKRLPSRVKKNLPRYAAAVVLAVDFLVLSGVIDIGASEQVKGVVVGAAALLGFSFVRQGVTPYFEDPEDPEIANTLDDEYT